MINKAGDYSCLLNHLKRQRLKLFNTFFENGTFIAQKATAVVCPEDFP